MAQIEIKIDIPDELDPEKLEQEAEALVTEVAEMARAHWIQLAGETFKTTHQDYVNGSQEVEQENRLEASITLKGVLPNMLEQGHEAYDMKEGMLESPKAKTSAKGGKYLAIPMTHGGPGQTKEPVMASDVWQKAKKMKMGERLTDMKHFSENLKGYKSKTGIYHGMKR